MTKKQFFYATSVVLLAIIIVLLFNSQDKYHNVQKYVSTAYSEGTSLIHAYPHETDSQYLSESIGLYMNYLLLANDAENFDKQVQNIKEQFIVYNNDDIYILWTLDKNTSVNSLIDDVRIINCLIKGSKQFDKKEYKELAKKFSKTLEKKQKNENIYTDYVDWTINKTASRITLSYLTHDFFETLQNTKETEQLLLNTNSNLIFFPEYYDISQEKYKYAQEVHMIDQLIIAINRQELDISSPAFQKWITSEWKTRKKILGKYTRNTLRPSVEYESLSVYTYLFKYFKLINQDDLANEIKTHAQSIADNSGLEAAHFFDYILYEEMLISGS